MSYFSVLCVLLYLGCAAANQQDSVASAPNPMPPPVCPADLCIGAANRDESVVRDAIDENVVDVCNCVCDETTGETLLHETAKSEAVAFASLLLDVPPGCDVDVEDIDENTPLHTAAAECNTPMAWVFLTAGANPEERNGDDDTPMCVAARVDNPNCAGIILHLLEFGAGICTKCDNVLPIDLAANQIVKDIIVQNDGDTC